MKNFLAVIWLILQAIFWVVKNAYASKAEKEARKKEIHEAIASGDIGRVHRTIDSLRMRT